MRTQCNMFWHNWGRWTPPVEYAAKVRRTFDLTGFTTEWEDIRLFIQTRECSRCGQVDRRVTDHFGHQFESPFA